MSDLSAIVVVGGLSLAGDLPNLDKKNCGSGKCVVVMLGYGEVMLARYVVGIVITYIRRSRGDAKVGSRRGAFGRVMEKFTASTYLHRPSSVPTGSSARMKMGVNLKVYIFATLASPQIPTELVLHRVRRVGGRITNRVHSQQSLGSM